MRKTMKRVLGGMLMCSMVLTSMTVPSYAKEAEKDTKAAGGYIWLDNDKYIEYPAEQTSAAASSTQSGYGANRLLDGNNDTRWEASWSNAPASIDVILSAQKAEYITGIEYVSRLDNNINGTMSDYEIFVSEDGSTYEEEPVATGKVMKKLGTYFLTFEEPVKAKSVKITSDVQAASEMRLLYVPSDAKDYTELLAQAEDLGENAREHAGMDNGLWLPDTLDAFDAGLANVPKELPDTEEDIYEANRQLFELIRDLKRAQLESTVELNGRLRAAEAALESATVGETPLTWSQEAIDTYAKEVTAVGNTAGSQVAGTGLVADGLKTLEDAAYAFNLAQNKPAVTFTGEALQPLAYIVDGVTASHFQGRGKGENVYLELDYENMIQFESLTFQTWWAAGQCIKQIKVQYKDESGNWNWVEDGKVFSMNWTTNTAQSESKTVNFASPVKGSAVRIYIIEATSSYVIDELTVGFSVAEEDMRIYIEQEEVELAEGESLQLVATVLPETASNKNVTWSSSDESVVSVKQDGTITVVGIPKGQESVEVVITATTQYGNKTAQCVVTAHPKLAEESDKEICVIRLQNAWKLVNAAKKEDYKENAIAKFKAILTECEEALAKDMTVGAIADMEAKIKDAQKEFEAASLIPIRETKNLIERVTGKDSSDNFIVEIIPADEETGMDVYEVDYADGKVILRGNNGVALATAYNYYLKYYAYLDFPYVGESNLVLPQELPVVEEPVRIVFPYEYRHYFNENCEYKYTTVLYGEEEWQHRIDWMAMNGFNMFLVDIGDHAVWYNAKEELGLDDAALEELRRSNKGTEQYYGRYELSQEAVEKEGALAKKVVEMAFALGMEPEIRPFVGQVPFMFPNQREDYYGSSSKAKMIIDQPGSLFDGMFLYSAARWMNLPQGVFISPSVETSDSAKAEEMHDKFQQISDIYYESLMETLGFNEHGRTPKFGYKDLIGEQGFVVSHAAFPRTVLKEMSDQLLKLNPDAIWMQTSWRYQTWLTQYYEEGHLMFVDLSADNRPKWNTNNEFGQTQWLWSMLFNFGGNTGLGGGMDHIASNVIDTRASANFMKGVAIAPEGGDTNPALYGLMAEMTWRLEKPDMDQWLKDYAKRRYGADNYAQAQEEIDRAWDTMHHTIYSKFVAGDGPSQTLINAMPKLSGAKARTYGSNDKVYQTQDIFPIWEDLIKAAKKMDHPTPQFIYDLVDITRQVLADISGEVYANIQPSFVSGDKEEAMRYANLMIEIAEDLDEILATNEYFLVGTRLEGAKNRGVTDSDQAYFEEVERTFLTYWVLDDPLKGTEGLLDYCNRHLAGLMTDYYGMRWEIFAKYLEEGLDAGMNATQFNNTQQPKIKNEVLERAEEWAEDRTPYPTEATGDSIKVSEKLWKKYQSLIKELYDPEATDDSRDIPADGMTATAGSQQSASGSEGPASNVLDNNAGTIWHSKWAGEPRENLWIDIKLAEPTTVGGLRYLTRSAGGTNGIITRYRIEVSQDNGETYTTIAEGKWNGSNNWKLADFEAAEGVTNVRLYAVDSLTQDGKNYASAAEIRLLEPRAAEPVETDKEDLAALIKYAEDAQKAESYQYLVPKVKELFEKALADAVAVNENAAATQTEVDKAYDALLAKVHLLDFTGNAETLQSVVSIASGKVESAYTKESWAPFKAALEAAQAVLRDANTLQAEINAACDTLQEKMDALVKIEVNKDKLAKLVADAAKYEAEIAKYTKDTAAAFMAALEGARGVLETAEVQDEVNAAYSSLKLEDLLGKVKAMDLSVYSVKTASAVKAAYAQAVAVFEDENADQKAVDAAAAALEEAVKAANAEAGDHTSDKSDKVASSDTGNKTTATGKKASTGKTTSKTAGNTAAKTGDGANTAIPVAALLVAVLTAIAAWKKKAD